ncbi:N-acetyl-gamma-glutamyl-phosphate reductase [Verticiella sediminum]|uniref:N-acetyl-gamma-glutamyl-phosphate reductase n=1 Tax=Verticiella sediminum TaxID=1247510 RepID=A0A556AUP4_9BURK|nr:N-acetyl-gamma-glutamyl-phosphate reductase [Verticiella sediminum]TSH96669.1 N-acetyl-gamma-glutamyl-phosphate reductase [Verticiella sediminum]
MAVHRLYIDGQHGTTGLRIREQLAGREDIEVLDIAQADRHSVERRRELLNEADVVMLCLPDDASREAVAMIERPEVRVIDASSAHRVSPDWVYGFPEMAPGQREAVRSASRVSNPGCYATGAIALLRPLVDAGVLPADARPQITGVSGYTGGGKSLIAIHEGENPEPFAFYATELAHKHTEEIRQRSRLERRPMFLPSEGHFPCGMLVAILLPRELVPAGPKAVQRAYAAHYAGEGFIRVAGLDERASLLRGGFVRADTLAGTNELEIMTFGGKVEDDVLVIARLDNLGKGASGAAIQNLNIMLGMEEARGLR